MNAAVASDTHALIADRAARGLGIGRARLFRRCGRRAIILPLDQARRHAGA